MKIILINILAIFVLLIGTFKVNAQENPFDKGIEQKEISEPKNFFIAPLWGMNINASTNHDYESTGNTYGANFSFVKDKHKRTLVYVVGLHYSKIKYKPSDVNQQYNVYFEHQREQLSIPILIRIARFAEMGVSYHNILNAEELNALQNSRVIQYNKEYWRIFYGFGGRFITIGQTGIYCQLHVGFNLSPTGSSLLTKNGKFNDGFSAGFNISYNIPIK